ncbi:uncharacterized protein LTR77_000390 [Saxophila tyrrhenica]|uniref:C2H2-type domain-containing protein n=1 Tax=Saxophila tyrrhenica TaxID=1690608 RepID=A0AAV9PSE1_9PEZI|nr:hypothetical protein LTR77_000390 [Saxophila tyrrhenica]
MAAVMMGYPPRDSFQGYPQQYAIYSTRAHQPGPSMAQSLNVNPYAHYASAAETQQYLSAQQRSHQSSSVMVGEDGAKPSLPSISNLLDLADGDRSSQEAAIQQAQMQAQQSNTMPQQPAQAMPVEQRQQQTYPSQDLSNSQRTAIPPTPPLRNDSVIEGTHSPSTISTGSSLSVAQPYFMASALNNVEATDQRSIAAQQFIKRHSIPSQPNVSPYGAYSTSPYSNSPGGASTGSYYSPPDPSYPPPGLYSQRQLPSNFPPSSQMPPPSAPMAQPSQHSGSPPKVWEHHHYINPSSQAQFPQLQERYICQTCSKAFSRPSSLKIHSHSHTGEKPFKCPHAGCGKAFSVRSNMKRHERGCHTAAGAAGGVPHLYDV